MKNIFKISPCYFRQDLISRHFHDENTLPERVAGPILKSHMYLIRREIKRPRKRKFLGCIWLKGLEVFREKIDFSM